MARKGLIEGFPKLAQYTGGPSMFYRYDNNGCRAKNLTAWQIDIPGPTRNDYSYVTVKIGDLLVLVYPRKSFDYSLPNGINSYLMNRTGIERDTYYFAPASVIGTKLPIACVNRWKVKYKWLPLIDAREIIIFDEDWVTTQRSIDGLTTERTITADAGQPVLAREQR